MRKEDKCIWDKFGKEDLAKLVRLVDRADTLLEKYEKEKSLEERKDR